MAVDTLARAIAAGKTPVSAYEMAVAGGYEGTLEQFEADLGNSGTNATNAANSADAAAASATAASNAATNLAPAYSTSATYAVGDHVLYDGGYYVCNTAITTAEAWTAAHWTAVKVGPEITDLKSAVKQFAFKPKMRNGSVGNPGNVNVICFDYIVPVPDTGMKILFNPTTEIDGEISYKLDAYIIANQPTNGNNGSRELRDIQLVSDYLPLDAFARLAGFSITVSASKNGETVPLRINDVGEYPLVIIYKDEDAHYNETISAIANDDANTLSPINYEYGSLSGQTGLVNYTSAALTRIVTKNILNSKDAVKYQIEDGYRAYFCYYDSEGNFVSNSGWVTGEYTVNAGSYYKYQITNLDQTFTIINDKYTLSKKIISESTLVQRSNVLWDEYKNRDGISIYPQIRDGSAANPGNAYAVAMESPLLTNGYNIIAIKINRVLADGHYYRFQLSVYKDETGTERIIIDKNYDINGNVFVLTPALIGYGKRFNVAIYDRDYETETPTVLRVANLPEDFYEIIYGYGNYESTDYVLTQYGYKQPVMWQMCGRITYLQAFLIKDDYIYSTDGTHLCKETVDGQIINDVAISVGHGNTLQLGDDGYAYISGWDDATIYVVDLDAMTVIRSISLPLTSAKFSACVDTTNQLAFIIWRDQAITNASHYNFSVFDIANNNINYNTQTIKISNVQGMDLYNDSIYLAAGLGTTDSPNQIIVFNKRGECVGEYHIADITTELEGICMDRDLQNIYTSDANKLLYRQNLSQ